MITKGNKTVVDIFYGNKPISKVYKGNVLVFEAQSMTVPPPTEITQLTLDQSISDPTKMVTGVFGKEGNPKEHVASWIRANSHRYVGTYNTELGMILKQLNDKNSTKYADGTDASIDITTKDVFMKMPDFWFRGEKVEENKYNIYFSAIEPTDGNTWIKWDSNTLIGVYKAGCSDTGDNTNGELYSRSGLTPTINVSQENFKAKARNRSNGDDHFMTVIYEAHVAMALLYIAYYGDNMNAQIVLGTGGTSYPRVTGKTDMDGMYENLAIGSINFWGLENWYGDICEFIDNLITYSTSGDINILDYYGSIVRQVAGKTGYTKISKMLLGESLDMIPTAYQAGDNTYYCDSGDINPVSGRVAIRSGVGASTDGGPFCIGINYFPIDCSALIGSRLLYHGRVVVANDKTAIINSVDIVPATVGMKKVASTPSVTVVIKGDNLDKLDDNITGLPEGATVSWLSEGTTERVVTITGVSSLESLKFNFGGYEVSIVNPDSLPADLQRVFYNEKEVLRTGMDFHICNVEDFSKVSNIKLQGLNINYSDIIFSTTGNVKVYPDSNGYLTVRGFNFYDTMDIALNYKDEVIGTLKIHKGSEGDILKAIESERMS